MPGQLDRDLRIAADVVEVVLGCQVTPVDNSTENLQQIVHRTGLQPGTTMADIDSDLCSVHDQPPRCAGSPLRVTKSTRSPRPGKPYTATTRSMRPRATRSVDARAT